MYPIGNDALALFKKVSQAIKKKEKKGCTAWKKLQSRPEDWQEY